MSQH
jgi:amino acid transporter